jgi:hypothetical protein
MSASAVEPVRWSRRRWTTTIATLLLIQIALVVHLGDRPHELTPTVRSRTRLYLAVDDWSAKQIAELPTLDDPTLFALPSMHGFSGKAWLTFPLLDYQMTGWSEPPSYLALNPDQLGKVSSAATNEPAPFQSLGKPAADLFALQLTIPLVNVRAASGLHIEGGLQNRRLLDQFHLPSWPSEDLLTNTVVQMLVNEQGDTISTALLGSSNSKDADDFALKCARGAQFEPLHRTNAGDSDSSSSGRLIFQWHTISPPETNAISGKP